MEGDPLKEIEERAMYTAFFGSSEDYYLRCLDKVKKGVIINLNIYALIGNIFWFCYRRMTIETIIIGLIHIGLYIAGIIFGASFFLLSFGIFSFTLGLLGNYLYIKKAMRTIEKANEYDKIGDKFSYISEEGGTNILDSLLIVAIPMLFFIALFIFVVFIMGDPVM
ncbi:hypothetical protein M2451_001253 [Dysgonomonas sp. PFB1-18]|uniref:DUF2628 domain-containing protein n=1 Tax=unclassified Dysgonomonas TaxID=2630389 RepID=UPI0024736667|nr:MULTISPECIES: DUF2628 domain-containing protein [unclassified Dysgonomonas]MDH6308687.1 hypothetical protein [Dysgonomonas sp. PF1-14]MDH6338616.1 hypothetical protein [Dysgonomonas sp. PF1-16]MDH6379936.1 hypothetical protein [Dysgonomonas sp. PFB1-18]MDH6397444.1 hypothetical protein [Dysgonomonas sp. PF1-23]